MANAGIPTEQSGPQALADEAGKSLEFSAGDSVSDLLKSQSMALSDAYEALEQVRKANVDIEFGERVDPSQCIPCLRGARKDAATTGVAAPRGRRVRRLLPRNRAAPCLACGSPVCPRHRCQDFRRENITICSDCSKFFSLDFIVDATDETYDERKKLMNSMLDAYDRALLILQYSTHYIDEVAEALEHNKKRNNKVGLGSSATGLVSGIAGVAAAATIFTPVGPPLLVASILFGGGATAVSASSEAVNYYCEPSKMADRIITLHGMVHNISLLAATKMEMTDDASPVATNATGGEMKSETRSLNWTRATTNALKPLTAGALSAVSVVMEAREIKATVQKIRAGDHCEKAKTLQTIRREMVRLPETKVLAEESRKYFLMEEM